MTTCQYKYKSKEFEYSQVDFTCKEKARTGSSTLCIFHDKNYVKDHYVEFEHEATKRFEEKVRDSISENKSLECIGYFLPAIEFTKHLPTNSITNEKIFSQPLYFNEARFYEKVDFSGATFSDKANFFKAKFSKEVDFSGATFSDIVNFFEAKFSDYANFSGATFSDKANFHGATFSDEANFYGAKFSSNDSGIYFNFNYVLFEKPNKVLFDKNNLSKVSFAGSDITRIKFGDKIRWGKDGFTIVEEEWLRDQAEGKQKNIDIEKIERLSLELVLSVYRNLRENYEFRLRYDDAGKFFIKEMELKRKYRHISSKYDLKLIALHGKLRLKWDKSPLPKAGQLIENCGLRRHFSLTGLYYHLSKYGESIVRPTIIGIITIGLSTLFWLTQSNPTLQPSFSANNPSYSNIANFTGTANFTNLNHLLKSFERSFADFLPLLPMGSEIKVGVIDYIIKIVGGALTFGLLAIALRRKFERKYTR